MIRFLADVGVSISTVQALRDLSHDAFHLAERGLERLVDDEILSLARSEGRVVVAFDLDFGDLLAAGGHAGPSVILFRVSDQTPASVTPRLLEVLAQQEDALRAGAIVIIEDRRYRVRRLPIRS